MRRRLCPGREGVRLRGQHQGEALALAALHQEGRRREVRGEALPLRRQPVHGREPAASKAAGKAFDGRPYDSYFGWGDDRIYCSELIYNIYRNALGIEIGVTRKLKDFDIAAPLVASALKQRYGEALPLEEVVFAALPTSTRIPA